MTEKLQNGNVSPSFWPKNQSAPASLGGHERSQAGVKDDQGGKFPNQNFGDHGNIRLVWHR